MKHLYVLALLAVVILTPLAYAEEKTKDDPAKDKGIPQSISELWTIILQMQAAIDSISAELTAQEDKESTDISAIDARLAAVEELTIPDFEKKPIILSYKTKYDYQAYYTKYVTLELLIQAYHDGGYSQVRFLDPSMPNSEHWVTPNTEDGRGGAIFHEMGINQYSFTGYFGDTLTGNSTVRITGDLNEQWIIPKP